MSPLSDVALFFTHGSFCFRWCECTSCRSPGEGHEVVALLRSAIQVPSGLQVA